MIMFVNLKNIKVVWLQRNRLFQYMKQFSNRILCNTIKNKITIGQFKFRFPMVN